MGGVREVIQRLFYFCGARVAMGKCRWMGVETRRRYYSQRDELMKSEAVLLKVLFKTYSARSDSAIKD